MRILLGLMFFVHGIAHLVGFVVAWQVRSLPEVPFRTTILAGSIDVGRAGIRLVGVAWLVAALAFALLALAMTFRFPWWQQAAYAIIGFSLILCLLGWPDSRLGMIANVVLAALLLVSKRLGWLL
jgi:hypothetical protein